MNLFVVVACVLSRQVGYLNATGWFLLFTLSRRGDDGRGRVATVVGWSEQHREGDCCTGGNAPG